MFNKLLKDVMKKVDSLTEEAKGEASKTRDSITRGIRNAASENNPLKNITKSFTETLMDKEKVKSFGEGFAKEVERISLDQRAKEIGVTAEEVSKMTIAEQAEKAGMTVDEYEIKWGMKPANK